MQKQFGDLVNAVVPLLPITKKAQVEDYVQCLMRFYGYLIKGKRSKGSKSKVDFRRYKRGNCAAYIHNDPAIGLRFLAELENLGFIEVPMCIEGKKKQIAYIVPTDFLKSLLVEYPPHQNTIRYPVKPDYNNDNYEVRLKSGLLDVIKSPAADAISSTVFIINTYILDLLELFPKYNSKDIEFITYYRTISEARRFRGKEFRFPYFFDSRLRIYSDCTVGFNPQGADHEKALILPIFKEVLTPNGLKALRESCHGYSEMDWCDSTMIAFARYPERYRDEWMKADKPFCFMACANLLMQHYDDPTKPLPSFTPLDGRCSGLQHWSAMLGSDAITNRLGMEESEAKDGLDIYEYVAYVWKGELEEEYKLLITRKLCKKPVMTFAYSATRMSSMENCDDILGRELSWVDGEWVVAKEGLGRKETFKLGGHLFNVTNKILQPMVEGVEYLKDCVEIIMTKTDDTDIIWATFDGYTCTQRAFKKEEMRVRVSDSLGKQHEIKLQVPQLNMFGQQVPSISKGKSGIGPNIIHSLDATHLRMVAMRLFKLSIPAIWVHDSFSVHSNYRELLYKIIVEEFIKLYSVNHLQILKELWESTYNVELPEPPSIGTWDINTLNNCARFFE
jgi:DNA-directed RNA polymerase